METCVTHAVSEDRDKFRHPSPARGPKARYSYRHRGRRPIIYAGAGAVAAAVSSPDEIISKKSFSTSLSRCSSRCVAHKYERVRCVTVQQLFSQKIQRHAGLFQSIQGINTGLMYNEISSGLMYNETSSYIMYIMYNGSFNRYRE